MRTMHIVIWYSLYHFNFDGRPQDPHLWNLPRVSG
jgi:hypothetical protein